MTKTISSHVGSLSTSCRTGGEVLVSKVIHSVKIAVDQPLFQDSSTKEIGSSISSLLKKNLKGTQVNAIGEERKPKSVFRVFFISDWGVFKLQTLDSVTESVVKALGNCCHEE